MLAIRLPEAIEGLSWSSDASLLAVGDLAGSVVILAAKAAVPAAMARPAHHPGGVTRLAWHPSRAVLASGGLDATVRIWTAPAGVRIIPVGGAVGALAWSPSGEFLAIGAGANVTIVDVTGDRRAHYPALTGAVHALAWAYGPGPLAVGTHGGIAWLSPGKPGEPLLTWDATGAVRVLSLDPDRRRLASGDLGGVVRITDLASHAEAALSGWTHRITVLAWDRAGQRLAIPDGGELTVWQPVGAAIHEEEPVRLCGHDGLITDAVYGGLSGTRLISAGVDGSVVRWTVERLMIPTSPDSERRSTRCRTRPSTAVWPPGPATEPSTSSRFRTGPGGERRHADGPGRSRSAPRG